jgi:predicted GNAT family N-acyltransferase
MYIKITNFEVDKESITLIRKQVFQEEQNVPLELEFDGKDSQAIQLLAYLNNQAVATTRIRQLSGNQVKIERLAVLPKFRRQGIATKLMTKTLQLIEQENYQEVIIHAQEYIKTFYQKLGFTQIGNTFTEAGIIHVKMVKKISKKLS